MTEDLKAKIDQAMINVMNARVRLLDAQDKNIAAKEALKDQEAALIIDGSYTASGKNEKEREAWLRSVTDHHRGELLKAEREERTAILNLELALDARRNLESILKIMELEAI
jgi:hypothetical protein